MVTAIVLIDVEHGHFDRIAQALVQLKGITEVYSVAGQHDLVAIVRTPTNEGIADIVTRQILEIEGITGTQTLMAFKVYSSYDLERMFAIGA
jgi:DNA-binding Lrp family transcriptional regulator